jgi:hypothetical protein
VASPTTPALVAVPEVAAMTKRKPPVNGPAPTAPSTTPTTTKPATSVPCKLVRTLDKNGETHFSCPCASCQ